MNHLIRRSAAKAAILSLILGLFVFPVLSPDRIVLGQNSSQTPSSYFDVRSYGARGDGKSVDSPAINRAIDAASARGGGTVFIPAGTYRSFSIRLKSNITLYFDQGSTLIAASPEDGDGKFDEPEPNKWDKYQDFDHPKKHSQRVNLDV
jgi:hypothetical protein